METNITGSLKTTLSMELASTSGKAAHTSMATSSKESEKAKAFGYRTFIARTLIFTRELMSKIKRTVLEFINGQMRPYMKGTSRMTSDTMKA